MYCCVTKTILVKLLRVEYKTLDIGEGTSPRKNLEEGTSSSGKKENLEEGISSSGVKVLVWIHQAEIVILLLGLVKEYNTQVRVGT